MSVTFTTKVVMPPSVLVRRLDQESVLLDLDSEQYFGLDEVGTRMLDALCSESSLEAAAEQLIDEYDADPSLLRDDLRALTEKLVERGLLRVVAD